MREKLAQNKGLMILLIAVAVMTMACFLAACSTKSIELSNTDFIRLHVVANSNTYEDQALKLKVRDACLSLLSEEMTRLAEQSGISGLGTAKESSDDVKTAAAYIRANSDKIQKAAEDIIRENGYDYRAEVLLSARYVPEKTYGKTTFPAGEYGTLTINIGEARGENWWCVLFPPLCLIDTSASANTPGEDAVKIDLKFKSAEVIERILE